MSIDRYHFNMNSNKSQYDKMMTMGIMILVIIIPLVHSSQLDEKIFS